jgi:hypothetical protein
MATIDIRASTLLPHGGGTPTAASDGDPAGDVDCDTPRISAAGATVLTGTPGESLAGWALGFIQLKFIATDYARYRGTHDSHGSLVFTRSNQIVCRDTDEDHPEVWYDPIVGGIVGGRGTLELRADSVIPPSGQFAFAAGFWDKPHRSFDAVVPNTATHRDNFVYHTDVGLAFCTMLVARDPARHFHFLKHFYWNVRWEALWQRDAAGVPQMSRNIHMQLNIQHTVHFGLSNDSRFRGQETNMSLPISNDVSGRPPRIHPVRDWSQM